MAEDVYLPQLPPDEFPYLNESAAALVAAGYDPQSAPLAPGRGRQRDSTAADSLR